jgi:hypothetical protein
MKLDILKKFNTLLLCLLIGFSLTACGGSGGSDAGQGTLSTSLTDSSTDEYQAVYVTIARVDVHHDGDGAWETVAEPNKTYDLLELVNGVRETLGIATLDTGHYTQMRLIIGDSPEPGALNMFSTLHPYANYVVNLDDEIFELKVPSGPNTGFKIVNGFDINENQTTELILDFDASRSIVKAGSKDKYLLKPTVKVLNAANYAIVSGTVTNIPPVTDPPTDPSLLFGALVTAQTSLAIGEAASESGTLTDENGDYKLFLIPGGYNLVTWKSGYLPSCDFVTLPEDSVTSPVDFHLDTAEMGDVNGTVEIGGASEDQYVTIEFRQSTDCGSGETTIIVKTTNIANAGTYDVSLPYGEYTIKASTYGKDTQTYSLTIGAAPQTQDIIFAAP